VKRVARVAGLAIGVVFLALCIRLFFGLHLYWFDTRCLTFTYPNHCDGAVAVQCEGGRGSLPLVRHTDCRESSLGPGVCVESPDPSGREIPFVECRTPCDPATFLTSCKSPEHAIVCFRPEESRPFEVVEWHCPFGCTMVTTASGARKASCVAGPGSKADAGSPW